MVDVRHATEVFPIVTPYSMKAVVIMIGRLTRGYCHVEIVDHLRFLFLHALFGDLDLSVSQIGLDLADLAKLLLRVRGSDRWWNDHIIADLPVDRSSDALLVAGLQGVNDAQYLSGVATGRGGVHHGQTDLLARVDDENGADGEGNTLLVNVVQVLLVDHVIQESDLAVSISDDGELQVGRGHFVDVLDPFAVGADIIGALVEIAGLVGALQYGEASTNQANHLNTALLKLAFHLRKSTKLCSAYRSEIRGVRKEDSPAIADELVEVDLALGGQSLEVRGYGWPLAYSRCIVHCRHTSRPQTQARLLLRRRGVEAAEGRGPRQLGIEAGPGGSLGSSLEGTECHRRRHDGSHCRCSWMLSRTGGASFFAFTSSEIISSIT